MFRKGVWMFGAIFWLVSCGGSKETTLPEAEAEPSEDLVEVVEVPPKVEAEEVGAEEVAKPNPNLIPMELRQQMIAYLTETEETQDEISMVEGVASLPFDLMLGRDFADFLEVHGAPNAMYSTFDGPPSRVDSYLTLFPDMEWGDLPINWASYEHLGEWLGFAVGANVIVDAENVITLVIFIPYYDSSTPRYDPAYQEYFQRFCDAERAFFAQAYQPLADNREAKIALINKALEKGDLQSWRARTFYRLLGNFVYLTPDGYLVDSAGFYIDAMRYAREGGISTSDDETQMDEALWQENFPASPFRAQVGDSLQTLLKEEAEALSFFLEAYFLNSEKSDWLSPEVGIRLDEDNGNSVEHAFREATDADNPYVTWWNDYGGGIAMISLMAIKPEHRLMTWQERRNRGSYPEDLYFVDKAWQGLAIRVVYRVRADKIVRRYYLLASQARHSW